MCVCVCVCVCTRACVCVCVRVIFTEPVQPTEPNVTKLSMHERGLCNKARRDRNQAMLAPQVVSFTERVVLMALHEYQDGVL